MATVRHSQPAANDPPKDMPETLSNVLAQHDVHFPPQTVERLETYCALLWEWNEKLNLTRHTGYPRFVARDLRDTLVLADHLDRRERVLDIGTGGGVPGVVLALLRDDLHVELCESVAKKARAVADIVRRLQLRTPVHHARAEDLLEQLPRSKRFDTLVARAVARLPKLLRWLEPHWDRFGRLLVIKGPGWVDERAEARHLGLMKPLALRRLATYPLPGTDAESVLMMICPKQRGEGATSTA